jgi:diguanylate cyclase (GGDEF)-like protein/PAS domain S-box-containing protein
MFIAMQLFETRTVMEIYALVTAVCVIVVASQWRHYRSRYRGLGYWVLDYSLQLLGLALIAARGAVPDILSVTVGNAAIVAGFVALIRGLEAYFGKDIPGLRLADRIGFSAFVAVYAYFTVISPSLGAREIALSLAMILACARGIGLLFSLDGHGRRLASQVYVTLGAFAFVSALRIALVVSSRREENFFAASPLASSVLVSYMLLFVILTFTLVSMVGRRIYQEKDELIEAKTKAEGALRTSEEMFARAFKSSPDAMCITRLSDGRFIEVNESFCRISGYSREEALGDPPINVWSDADARPAFAAELQRTAVVERREIEFVIKGGRELKVDYSGSIIDLRGDRHILSIISDPAARDRAAAILRIRLELREYANGHSLKELMTKALDGIEAMTESSIGFYHIVDEQTGELTLGTWSTRTVRDFCRAEGEGSHYPIESAGVWADAIRARKPIVHNDYASLPGKKGMPEGHAVVLRELVAPTFREGRCVAILGVGNKPVPYRNEDIALVSYVADLIWTIMEEKRAQEQIIELNRRLAELAMTDELTGSANRRAFFAIADRELAKAGRYSSPLSFLMIDIDNFKEVNDAHGHDAGDAVLRSVVGALKEQVRDVDLVARLGGEEFGVLMPSTRLSDALVSAERLRAAVAKSVCEFGGVEHKVTISIGVSTRADGVESLDAIMKAADEALYRAKAAGRDRVIGA